jgi:hypothetical protein
MTRTHAVASHPPGNIMTVPGHLAARSRPAWRMVNITPAERTGRIVIGLAAVVAAVVLLAGAGSVLGIVLEALLIAAGLDLAITGALGHCPLYAKLGYLPR